MAGSASQVVRSLVVNLVVAIAKGIAAVVTGSGSMMAETLHSTADCGNQLLLLLGIRRAAKPADAAHPLGYGRALYFWSFMVAMLLFLGGGCYSAYEGIHKIRHPEPVGDLTAGLVVLVLGLVLEAWATYGNIREFNAQRGGTPFFRHLRQTKDSDLVVVFGENSAAVLGLALAFIALVLAGQTGNGQWDGIGSLAIGVVLLGVAVFLAVEVKSLLMGESADPRVEAGIARLVAADADIEQVVRIITLQQGPGQVMVAMKIRFRPGLQTGGELCAAINRLEGAIEQQLPEVKWTFIEPDHKD
jgi:cation diffusion facilitator family transporter